MNSVSEENVRLRHNLISHHGNCVESTGKSDKPMHVLVQFLLPLSQHLPAQIFAAEVRCQRINDY
jgi:hypothetical protein